MPTGDIEADRARAQDMTETLASIFEQLIAGGADVAILGMAAVVEIEQHDQPAAH